MSVIIAAAKLAQRAHRGQVRDGTERPYIEHPMRVAGRMSLHPKATEVSVAAAWLHDVVEDTDYTRDEVEQACGPSVARLVDALTNQYTAQAYPEMRRAERKRLEVERICATPVVARLIKLLDRLDNLQEGGLSRSFAPVYAAESRALAEALYDTDPGLTRAVHFMADGLDPGCDADPVLGERVLDDETLRAYGVA